MDKMFKKIGSIFHKEGTLSVLSSITSIVIGLLIGLVIMLAFNPSQAFGAFITVTLGGFTEGMEGIGDMLFYATPIILTGLAVAFAFKTGLFNIGVVGQLTIGATAGVFVGIKFESLPMSWLLAVLAAMLAGALWAMIPAILKAFFNVNEVVSGIMCNYIGMYLSRIVIMAHMYNSVKGESQSVPKGSLIPNFGLDSIFTDSHVTGGLVLAILAVIVIYILLEKTTFCFELKAVGKNKDAAKYAGIREKKSVLVSLGISGAIAGLAATTLYLTTVGRHLTITDNLISEGFDGIPVALLGFSNPIGVLFAGLFIGNIKVGGFLMQLYEFAPEIIDIIVAVIIYLSALSTIFKGSIKKFIIGLPTLFKRSSTTGVTEGSEK